MSGGGPAGTAGAGRSFGVTVQLGSHGGRVLGWYFLVTHLLILCLWSEELCVEDWFGEHGSSVTHGLGLWASYQPLGN